MAGADGRDVYVELIAQGNVVKATAIDSETGIEATIVGPASAGRAALEAAAIRKLEYLLRKRRGEN